MYWTPAAILSIVRSAVHHQQNGTFEQIVYRNISTEKLAVQILNNLKLLMARCDMSGDGI